MTAPVASHIGGVVIRDAGAATIAGSIARIVISVSSVATTVPGGVA